MNNTGRNLEIGSHDVKNKVNEFQFLNEKLDVLDCKYSTEDDEEKLETGLLETLSLISSFPKALSSLSCLWKILNGENLTAGRKVPETAPPEKGLRVIAKIVRRLSCFNIHSCAAQAIAFSADDHLYDVFRAYCLLLCGWSLQKCSPQPRQWKRSQSILCETIRLYQDFRQRDFEIKLWFNCISESCLKLKSQLPEEALHVGISASLAGTTFSLLADHPNEVENCLKFMISFMKCEDILHHFKEVNSEILSHEQISVKSSTRNDLYWWITTALKDDSVCFMDTSWNEKGVAIFASACWSEKIINGAEISPDQSWSLFSPHVPPLLMENELREIGLTLLENVLLKVPPNSLLKSSATNAINLIQLLSNFLIDSSYKRDAENVTCFSNIIQKIVTRFNPATQVDIICDLVKNCPYHGLEPWLLGLLRYAIGENTPLDMMWIYFRDVYVDEIC